MSPDTAASLPTVGFIGLGDQGAPIAQAIADSDFPLLVWARNSHSFEALDGFAYETADSIADLAVRSDIVALCLPEDRDVIAMSTGDLLANMRPGTILVNHGTGLPTEAIHLAALAEPYGVQVVDAPVSGGRTVALARRLTAIVGGPKDAVDRVTPVFRSFSQTVIHVGDAGAGQYGKLFNNALLMMNQQSIAETLAAAEAVNIPLGPLLEVLTRGSARSFALEALGPSVTAANADHLRKLQLIDMDLFSAAAGDTDEHAGKVTEWAVAGAEQLPELAARVEAAARRSLEKA